MSLRWFDFTCTLISLLGCSLVPLEKNWAGPVQSTSQQVHDAYLEIPPIEANEKSNYCIPFQALE